MGTLFKFSILAVLHMMRVYCLECYKCDSNERADCVTKPGEQLPVVECPKEKDFCVTAIIDRVTHRGCLSSVLPGRVCSPQGLNLCIQCNEPLCNVQPYPPDRRSCYQCIGSSCIDVSKSKITSTPCRNYVKRDNCYTEFISTQTTVRGCTSDKSDPCRSMKCLSCNFDACNDLVGVSEHICYSCTYMKNVQSYKNPSCKRPQYDHGKCSVRNVTTCSNKVLLGDKGQCYTFYNEQTDVVIRGCSSNMGAMVNGKLTECYGDLCNDDCVDIKCVVCDSKKDPKCRNVSTYTKTETCPVGTNYCVACEDREGQVTRGCGIKSSQEGRYCVRCYGEDGCNKGNIRTCYKCSSASDPDCAYWRNSSNIEVEICDDPLENCVATVLPNSYTVRGCESRVPECTRADANCKRCNGSLCNDGVIPNDRFFCHQCGNNSAECNEAQNQSAALPCLNYSLNDFCFAYANENNTMTRGCSSDPSYNDCRKLPDGSCRMCYESACNNWALVGESKLSCIQCNTTEEACPWGFRKESAKPCRNPVPYFLHETCYTYEHLNGKISRGCTLDYPTKLRESELVQLCSTPGCNNQNKLFQNCIQCSSEGEKCSNAASNISSTDCRSDVLQLFENRGCFVLRNPEGDIIRGCAIDLHKDDLKACKSNSNHCIYCTQQGCNSQQLPSSSDKMKLPSIFSLSQFFTIILCVQFN